MLHPLSENALKEIKDISDKIKYEDLFTIIYTSGTTGIPKGVMLSHKNVLSNVMNSIPCFPPGDNYKALSFLPLNHIFERMTSFLYLFKGVSMFFAENLETIPDNLREVKPNMFTTVPRLLEKVYEKIMQKGEELSGIKRKLFFWAHDLATKFEINKNQGFFTTCNYQLLTNSFLINGEKLWVIILSVLPVAVLLPGEAYKDFHCCQDSNNGGVWAYGNITSDKCKPI